MYGSNTAASMAMSAITPTISSSVKPPSESSLIPGTRHAVERDVGGDAAAAFLAVRTVRDDVVRPVLPRRAIHIRIVPGIVGDIAALQIGAIPGRDTRRAVNQSPESLGRRRKAAGFEIEQVERAGEALNLYLGGLDLGFAEIVQNPGTYQPHDEADDGDHHQHFDQREAGFADPARVSRAVYARVVVRRHGDLLSCTNLRVA